VKGEQKDALYESLEVGVLFLGEDERKKKQKQKKTKTKKNRQNIKNVTNFSTKNVHSVLTFKPEKFSHNTQIFCHH